MIRSAFSYLLLLTVFVSGTGIAEVGFIVYWHHFVYVAFLIYGFAKYRKLDWWVVVALALVAMYAIVTHEYGLNLVFKQIINISIATVVFYFFIRHEKFDFIEIFRKYFVVAKVILVLGFLQVILFQLNLGRIYTTLFPVVRDTNIALRLQSLTTEPSFFVYTMTPAIFVALYNTFYRSRYFISKTWSFLFIVGYLLTFSTIAYLSIAAILLVLYFRKFTQAKALLFFVTAGFIGLTAYLAYFFIPDVKLRVDDTMLGLTKGITREQNYLKVNISTYGLLSNAYVTKESLKENFFFGSGLGTHELSHSFYLPEELKRYSVLQRQDAGSLALRLLSETGVFGFLVFVTFLLLNRITYRSWFNEAQTKYWMINAGIFILFLLFLFRSGDYTFHGRILFLLIFYYTHKYFRELTDETPVVTDDATPSGGNTE